MSARTQKANLSSSRLLETELSSVRIELRDQKTRTNDAKSRISDLQRQLQDAKNEHMRLEVIIVKARIDKTYSDRANTIVSKYKIFKNVNMSSFNDEQKRSAQIFIQFTCRTKNVLSMLAAFISLLLLSLLLVSSSRRRAPAVDTTSRRLGHPQPTRSSAYYI